jgi:hypothetical protein
MRCGCKNEFQYTQKSFLYRRNIKLQQGREADPERYDSLEIGKVRTEKSEETEETALCALFALCGKIQKVNTAETGNSDFLLTRMFFGRSYALRATLKKLCATCCALRVAYSW